MTMRLSQIDFNRRIHQVVGACEERMNEKIGDIRERIGGMQEKLERKMREQRDQNGSIRNAVETMKTKQQYHERQMSQMTGLITSKNVGLLICNACFQSPNVDFNEFSKRCDELL